MEQSLMEALQPLGKGVFINVSEHHTFGTDAVLLAHFAAPKKGDSLIDLGTGCGIIPFLMLRDGLLKNAIGVDISPEAIALAEKSGRRAGFEKFSAVCSNLTELKGKVDFGCHSLVTCNPPYKAPSGGLKSFDPIEAAARHELFCTLEDIIEVSARLLKTSGRLCMCHRPERLAELMHLMSKHGIEPKKLRLVAKEKGRAPWLVLVEGRRCGNIGLKIEPTLYLYEKGELSDEMLEIYGPYKEEYLNG